MAANFPNSPSTNDTFTENGLTFVWDGSAWKLNSSSGTKGEKGQKGEVGVTGDKGQKGEKGEVGAKGQKGEIGATGGTGGTGDKGQKGEVGATGSAGAAAAKGQKGEVGATGSGGSAGDKGTSGDKGQKGEASTVKGDKGQKGEIGAGGDKGATGAGDKGQKGEEGPQGGGAPVGQIVAWSGSAGSLPSGYFLCDGSAISRSTYAALFAIVGTTHGSGNGSSTFNIPDLRDRFVVGSSNSTGDTTYPGVSPGATGGQADAVVVSHNHSVNDPTHGHSVNDPGHVHTTSFDGKKYFPGGGSTSISYGGPGGYPADVFSMNSNTTGVVVNAAGTGISVNSNGVSGTNKNLPPYYSLAYIIQFAQGGTTAKGQKGEQGATGSGGSTGDKGQKGEVGDKGAASSVQGPTGDKGQKGEVGATGSGGSTGSTGAKGQKGEIGAGGDKGATGAGDKGQKGEIGNTGSTGAKGQKGEVGAGGSTGSDGSDGDKGQKGDTGAQGSTGASGPATIPQIKKAENTAQFYTSNSDTHTRVTLALTGVDNNSHVLIMWRAEIFSGSGTGANCQTYLDGGSFTGGSTSGTHNVQNWAGFGDITIDRGSGTSRTYTIKFKKNSGAQAYFRNGYLFAMEMKPN